MGVGFYREYFRYLGRRNMCNKRSRYDVKVGVLSSTRMFVTPDFILLMAVLLGFGIFFLPVDHGVLLLLMLGAFAHELGHNLVARLEGFEPTLTVWDGNPANWIGFELEDIEGGLDIPIFAAGFCFSFPIWVMGIGWEFALILAIGTSGMDFIWLAYRYIYLRRSRYP